MPTVYEILSRDYLLTEVLTCSRFGLPNGLTEIPRTIGETEDLSRRCREAKLLLAENFPDEVRTATHQAGMLYYEFLHAEELYDRVLRLGAMFGIGNTSFQEFVRTFGLPQDEEVKAQVVRRGHQFLDETVHAQLSKHPVEFLADVEMLAKYRMIDRAFSLLDEGLAARAQDPDIRRIFLERGVELCDRYARPDRRHRYASELTVIFREAGDFDRAESLQTVRLKPLPIQISSTTIPGYVDETPAAPSSLEEDILVHGKLAGIGFFDVVQHVENLRLTAALDVFNGSEFIGRVSVLEGLIVDAQSHDGMTGTDGLRSLVRWVESPESKGGTIVVRGLNSWNVTIVVNSNMSLLLDLLRELDESNHGAGESGDTW